MSGEQVTVVTAKVLDSERSSWNTVLWMIERKVRHQQMIRPTRLSVVRALRDFSAANS